jgi:uncharacterized protein YbjT (DUF2867 family)
MRLLILGASGGCGQWLARLAAERGHDVTALVRRDATLEPHAGVTVRHGDPTDPQQLDAAVAGHDAVLSCLGLRRAGKSPWAPLQSPPDLTERVARALVPAMRRSQVARLVAISAGGVGDSRARLSWPVRTLVETASVGVAYRDLERMETVLGESGLDWCVARPVTLVDGAPTGGARAVPRYGLTSTIRRSDVAHWMLAVAEHEGPVTERQVLLGT